MSDDSHCEGLEKYGAIYVSFKSFKAGAYHYGTIQLNSRSNL